MSVWLCVRSTVSGRTHNCFHQLFTAMTMQPLTTNCTKYKLCFVSLLDWMTTYSQPDTMPVRLCVISTLIGLTVYCFWQLFPAWLHGVLQLIWHNVSLTLCQINCKQSHLQFFPLTLSCNDCATFYNLFYTMSVQLCVRSTASGHTLQLLLSTLSCNNGRTSYNWPGTMSAQLCVRSIVSGRTHNCFHKLCPLMIVRSLTVNLTQCQFSFVSDQL